MRYLVLLVAVFLMPAVASAQFGMLGMGQGGQMSAASMRKHFDGYADMLGMDDDQREAGRALVDVYVQEGKDMMVSFEARMQKIQDEMGEGNFAAMMDKMPDLMDEIMDEARRVEEAMLEDIKLLLDEDQAPLWPRVERRHRRITSMAGQIGITHGESADLIKIVEEIAPDDAPLPDDLLLAYEIDADRAITARNDMIQTEMRRIFDESMSFMMPGGGESDEESPFVRLRKAGLKIRDVNSRYARRFEAALPEKMRTPFSDRVSLASYPEVYSKTSVARRITAAQGLADLSADQKARIDALGAKYEREVRSHNTAYAAALKAWDDDTETASPMRSAELFMGGGEGELTESREAKNAFEGEINGQLDGMLSGEQIARLPEFSGIGYYQEMLQQIQEEAMEVEVELGDP